MEINRTCGDSRLRLSREAQRAAFNSRTIVEEPPFRAASHGETAAGPSTTRECGLCNGPRCKVEERPFRAALSAHGERALAPADFFADVLKLLGRPSWRSQERLVYMNEHQETIRGDVYDSSNIVEVHIRAGAVWAISVSKTISS